MFSEEWFGNLFCCVVLTLVTSNMAGGLLFVMVRSYGAAPAVCQEGAAPQMYTNATDQIHPVRVGIDIPPGQGQTYLECIVPIAVYPKVQGQVSFQPINHLRQLGRDGPGDLILEKRDSGVVCVGDDPVAQIMSLMSLNFYKHCGGEWECNNGTCTVFEKALRLCLTKISKTPYECSYVPGKKHWGVATGHAQGIVMFLGLILSVVLSIAFVKGGSMELTLAEDQRTWFGSWLVGCALLTCICFKGAQNAQPPRLGTLADLRAPCGSNGLDAQKNICRESSEIAVEDDPWNREVTPLVYALITFIDFACLACCLGFGAYVVILPKIRRMMERGSGEGSANEPDEHTPLNP